ncbi:MAG: ABC transporter substrate-binding protein [Rhodobacter sp.]|nr:ABC transporter substrate-binding protein [Rhodobacter sp.]MCA3462412.1 ABC transporter substrate-binding protein [Rhodobacter sp.]MCA3463875.1 ABC transporter substrate-binding protein [Rhodobacter sp.]MCA3466868.1 ABC transporter substrate-binding protein [Rhodobacter sp.]MCA3470767.1 ABC transporter substrate-binding protein [Rhodobacter sp.]
MKKLLTATAACALLAGAAQAEDIKLGIIFGFTGPIESLTGSMAAASEAAIAEVNASGLLLDGSTVTAIRADSTCVDSAAATAAAERLVTGDQVNAIIGGDCSGVTGAILQNVARPNGIVMISPSATSPALSTAEDDGLFFRTAPSDAREGEIAADIMTERGIKTAALTYTNNDYGKGLAEAISTAFEAKGGKITISAAHEDGKADYTAEVGALAAAGGDILIVAGYLDQGGVGVIRAALDTGAFSLFQLPGGMIGDNLTAALGNSIDGSFGQVAGTDAPGMKILADSSGGKFDVNSPYTPESYDAAALIMLAMQAAGSSKSTDFAPKIMDLANAPGEKIYPGELAKALELIKAGTDIDYVGASAVELVGSGESAGNYREIDVIDGKIVTTRFR